MSDNIHEQLRERRSDAAFMWRLEQRMSEDAVLLRRIEAGPDRPAFWYDAEISKQDGKPRVWFACPHDPGATLLDTRWTVQQIEPLTVTPSVHNTGCGCHGFITNGEWVPA